MTKSLECDFRLFRNSAIPYSAEYRLPDRRKDYLLAKTPLGSASINSSTNKPFT